MSSSKTIKIRDEYPRPQVGTCEFDLSGPCYLQPLVNFKAGKLNPGFLVADVILGQDLDLRMAAAFIRKCTLLANLGNTRPILPMLVADSFTPEALKICRSRGLIATRPETLFGQDVARALADLIKTLAGTSSTPSQIEGLFRRLSAIEGAAGNLRGALFELVVGHCVRSLEGGNIDFGLAVMDSNQNRAELDVSLVRERRVIVYECKGYQPASQVSGAEIEKWLSKKIPIIYRALRKEAHFSSSLLQFQFWTCGEFENEAIDLLNGAESQLTKYSVAWKNGASIREYVKGMSASGIRKILDEHYFNHPLRVFQD